MKKIFLYITLLFLFGCNKLNIISDVNFNKETRPNVLIISIDDLKDWVGFLNWFVTTPNIDKLASQGVAFTNAHTAQVFAAHLKFIYAWKKFYPRIIMIITSQMKLHFLSKQNGYYVLQEKFSSHSR